MPLRRSSRSLTAVMNTTGVCKLRGWLRICRQTSSPLMPGIRMSSSTVSAPARSSSASACSPLPASATS